MSLITVSLIIVQLSVVRGDARMRFRTLGPEWER
jgi:hypothetical protein